tara:strand:+ start:152 stop:412 length:261 start_codon:yes stop_codon:yes gene_type:complete
MKTTIQFNFDGKFFERTWNAELNEKQIKRETEFFFMDLEQYIVEKWLDRQASSSRMTESDRDRLMHKDMEKLESCKNRLKVIKHTR